MALSGRLLFPSFRCSRSPLFYHKYPLFLLFFCLVFVSAPILANTPQLSSDTDTSTIALCITAVAPLILLYLWLTDLKGKKLW